MALGSPHWGCVFYGKIDIDSRPIMSYIIVYSYIYDVICIAYTIITHVVPFRGSIRLMDIHVIKNESIICKD